MAWASTLSDTPQASISSSCDQRVCDLNKLVYRFNAETPWRYFRDGVPLACSVERGRKKRDFKLKKIYTRKWIKINARKNRPYKDTEAMSLLCSCDKGGLMRRPAHECRRMIQDLRAAFYQKSYNEQNYVLLGLMEVRVCPTGRRTISYNARNSLQRGSSNMLRIFPSKTPSSSYEIRGGWCLYPTRHERKTRK